jgi:hypothetical protein
MALESRNSICSIGRGFFQPFGIFGYKACLKINRKPVRTASCACAIRKIFVGRPSHLCGAKEKLAFICAQRSLIRLSTSNFPLSFMMLLIILIYFLKLN